MASKTIAFLLPDLGAGGAERVALRLTRSFLEAGHAVEFVLMRKRGELLADVPPEVRIVDLGASRVRDAIGPLARYFREGRPDAVQARMWPLTVAAIVARALARSPTRLVVSDHAVLSKQFADRPVALAFLKLTVRLFYPWADARLLVAKAAADDLARLSGLPRSSFEVIYNPVDPAKPDLRVTPDIESLWGQGAARILTVGSLKAQKNHRLLLRSFARLRERRQARLMILGSGPLEAELKEIAVSLDVSNDVIFPGFIADPWPYYASADLFALSSDYEGYPNVLVEAMRCGVPVVSTDCESGPREILDEGRFGKLVPVGDEVALATAMDETLQSPPPARLLLERAEELSGASTAQRYLDVLIGGA